MAKSATKTATKKKPAAKPAAKSADTEVTAISEAVPSPKEQRAALNKQFEEADEKGRAAIIEETQAGLGIRGY